jgi:hypothetical protein
VHITRFGSRGEQTTSIFLVSYFGAIGMVAEPPVMIFLREIDSACFRNEDELFVGPVRIVWRVAEKELW